MPIRVSFVLLIRSRHGGLSSDVFIPSCHTDRSKVYYWESIVLARKFLIVLVVVFLAQVGVSMQV